MKLTQQKQVKSQEKSELGRAGEEIACKYLSKYAFIILERNWQFRHKEIDIIALKDNILHVVEVKTRSSSYFERPQDAVTKQKQRFLITAINDYINQHDFDGEIQFDIFSVLIENGKETLEFIPDAFYPICK
jgi:putative endonuclease